MEIAELERIHGLLEIVRDRLKENKGDMMARGMIDELVDQYRDSEDPEAVEIVSQLYFIRMLLGCIDIREMGL
ncbi:MAG: hypothetical protein PHN69_06095 [Candidatus Pacebacteria bacterium]|nr:hypothetical protein [Candidatus Paceibacterota bacterium]